jgi:coenzyme F420 hydrogenase subunit beta
MIDQPNLQETNVFARLQTHVIEAGLCTHCGTCVGLSAGCLEMQQGKNGPLPKLKSGASSILTEEAFMACPGKGLDYPDLYEYVFEHMPENWLSGVVRKVFIGYSGDSEIRRRGASGGVITQVLANLHSQGEIDGAVVLLQGFPDPWLSTPIIARTIEEILDSSQSVYLPTSVNTLLDAMTVFKGRLAYVGLPDQVASLRRLQQLGHPGAKKVVYVLGPYVGTCLYVGAIESYLRSNHVAGLHEITELRFRAGEWPGYLQIKTRSGRVLQANKFYYNYLIPFYITRSSLLSVDFTNELTDMSVGDAWHPRFESRGGGYSVVLARTLKARELLKKMQKNSSLVLEETNLEDALSMHGHMIDFKKRGAFIRIGWRKTFGQSVPSYGYRPAFISFSRRLVEVFISGLFIMCRTWLARCLVQFFPLRVIGPVFDSLRKFWKNISKPTKRKGLDKVGFIRLSGSGV